LLEFVRDAIAFFVARVSGSRPRRKRSARAAKRMTTMKLNEHDGFDGLEENPRMYAAAGLDDDAADGYEGSGSFDDDEEEEVIVVAMTSDDDDDLDRLEEEAEALLEAEEHAEEAIIRAAPPSPVTG